MIVNSLRAGAFDAVAAAAAGISRRTFYAWLARGDAAEVLVETDQALSTAEVPWLDFAREVRQARALARLHAEHRVFLERPLEWLLHGPGRDRGPKAPGWTRQTAVPGPSSQTPDNAPTSIVVHYVDDWDHRR